jgi:hypothetical protein
VSTAHQGSRPVRFAAVGLDHAHAFGQIEGHLNQRCYQPHRDSLPQRHTFEVTRLAMQQSATMTGFAN